MVPEAWLVYCYRVIKKFSSQFPKANKKLIMEKLRESLRPVYKEFIQLYGPTKDTKDTRILEYEKLKYV